MLLAVAAKAAVLMVVFIHRVELIQALRSAVSKTIALEGPRVHTQQPYSTDKLT